MKVAIAVLAALVVALGVVAYRQNARIGYLEGMEAWRSVQSEALTRALRRAVPQAAAAYDAELK